MTATILALASVAVTSACSEQDDDSPFGVANDNTTVRFVNGASGGTNIDIAENGTVGTGNNNIAYGSASECTRVNDANPELAVRTANSTTSLPGFTTTGADNWDIYVNPGTRLGTPEATVVGRNKASPYLTMLAGQVTTIRLTNAGSTTTLQDISVPSPFSGTVTTTVVGNAAAGSTRLQAFALPACA